MAFQKYRDSWVASDFACKQTEDAMRSKYCANKDDICNGDEMLQDISDGRITREPSPYSDSYIGHIKSKYNTGENVTVSVKTFEQRLEKLFGFPVLKGSENVVLAGGMVVSGIDALTDTIDGTSIDADFFVYGLDPDGKLSDEEVRAKFDEIASALFSKIVARRYQGDFCDLFDATDIVMFRTEDSITLMCPALNQSETRRWVKTHVWDGDVGPLRVQFIQRNYRDKFHILSGFDVPACAVLYDGERVLALPRAVTALARQENLVDVDRQSMTFERRLLKYEAAKGFSIAVPGIDLASISVADLLSAISAQDDQHVPVGSGGLARLLVSKLGKQPSAAAGGYATFLKVDTSSSYDFGRRAYSAAIKDELDIVFASRDDVPDSTPTASVANVMYKILMDRTVRVHETLCNFKKKKVEKVDDSPYSWVSHPKLVKGDCRSFRPVEADWFKGF